MEPVSYTAFISYSQRRDRELALQLRAGLHQFAKPWYRLRARRVFLDQSSLTVNPGLWPAIEKALSGAENFILLASPAAARSRWVYQEIEYWLRHRDHQRLFIVLTDGKLVWDPVQAGFDWSQTDALPAEIDYGFADEPLFLDLRGFKTADECSLKNPLFRNVVADLVSALDKRPKDELIGEDVRLHRQARRLAGSAVTALVVLTIASMVAAALAIHNQRVAEHRLALAHSRELAANSRNLLDPQQPLALLLAAEAYGVAPTFEARDVLLRSLSYRPHLDGFLWPASPQAASQGGDLHEVVAVYSQTNGAHIATVLRDDTVQFWDAATRRRVHTLPPPPDAQGWPVLSAAFSRYAISINGAIHLQDPLDGTDPWIIDNPYGEGMLAFSMDATTLALGSGDGLIARWDTETGREVAPPLRLFQEDAPEDSSNVIQLRYPVLVLRFSHEGDRLAVQTSRDSETRIWDLATPAAMPLTLRHDHGRIRDLVFRPDDQVVAGIHSDGTLRRWDTSSGEPMGEPFGQTSSVQASAVAIAFDPTGDTLASGDRNGDLTLWRFGSSGPRGQRLRGHTASVAGLAFDPTGQQLISGAEDGSVMIWDLQRLHPLADSLEKPYGLVGEAGFILQGRQLAAVHEGDIRLWDAASGQLLERRIAPESLQIESFTVDRDGGLLVAGGWNEKLLRWDTRTATAAGDILRPGRRRNNAFSAVALSASGELIATGGSGGSLILWDGANGELLDWLQDSSGDLRPINDLIFFDNDSKLAVGSRYAPPLWDVPGRRPLASLPGDSRHNAVAINPAEILLAASVVGGIELWDLRTFERVGQLPIHINRLTGSRDDMASLAFSPDGSLLASGTASGQLLLWDVVSGRQLGPPLQAHRGGARNRHQALVFTPDGSRLVSTGFEMVSWDVAPSSWLQRACRLASRSLSAAEWRIYRVAMKGKSQDLAGRTACR